MKRLKFLIFLLAQVLVMAPISAATYYVADSGLDSNPGTENLPWGTVQKAADSALPGDRILVGRGVYEEAVTVRKGGTSDSPIVFDGQGTAQIHRVNLNAPFVVVQNFKFGGAPVGAWFGLVTLNKGAHHSVISNNFINATGTMYVSGVEIAVGTPPFDPSAPSHCLIVSNVITGVKGRDGVALCGNFNVFKGNIVTNLIVSDFVRLFGGTNTIIGNRFSNMLSAPEGESIGYHPDFVQTFGENGHGSKGHIIEGNIVSDIPNGQLSQLVETNTKGAGLIGDWTFRNNIFANIAAQASVSIPNTKWLNNVFYRCNYNSGHVMTFGKSDRGSAEGAIVLNNVFLDCGLLEKDNTGWYAVGAITNLTADYNMVSKNNYRPVRQESPASAFRWYERNGLNGGDPGFLDVGKLDFRLKSTSRLIDRGLNLTEIGWDLIGQRRPIGSSWDIGPFEFVPAAQRPNPPQNIQFQK